MVVVALLIVFFMSISSSEAKDLGVHGSIYPIAEEDPIALIQNKLKKIEEKGELKKHNLRIQKRTKESVERPTPVEGISKTTKSQQFTYDPTFTVQKDIKDHLGRVIHPKGTKINPLETVTMTEDLLFIDGDDPEQKSWAFDRIEKSEISHQNPDNRNQKERRIRLILVKGTPLALSEELGIPVYFDQGGVLVKKLGINHVPAIVGQSNPSAEKTEKSLCLHIEEVVLGDQE